ncbi:MAG: CofH family radical SAM protein [Planctomycetes bacterium]|nr:CofH family radical SAM protein [Planctomycetota bacterium]
MDPKVILETALHREEISAIEALLLMQAGDSLRPDLFETADVLTQRFHARNVTYVRSKLIHYTNICRAECAFCPFWRKKGQRGAFLLSADEVLRQIRDAGAVRQIDLQGGLNPDVTLDYLTGLLRTIKEEHPNLHLHGLSPSEIYYVAKRSRAGVFEVVKKLRAAGLDSLSGDSADILNDKLRKKFATEKLRSGDWVDVMRAAHRAGLPTTATLLFGHIEDEIQIGEHLDIIKNLQRETGGIVAFEPIPFVPANTAVVKDRKFKPREGIEPVLKMVAICRIFFARTIRHIQIDWTKLGWPDTLRTLGAGANDLGPLSVDAAEIRAPESNGKLTTPVTTLKSMVQKAGRIAVERDPFSRRPLPRLGVRQEEPALV